MNDMIKEDFQIHDRHSPISDRHYPNLKQSFGLLGIFILIQILVSVIVVIFGLFLLDFSPNSPVIFFAVYTFSFVLIIWYGLFRGKMSGIKKLFFFNHVPFVVYPILLVLSLAVIVLIDPLISLIPLPDVINKMFQDLFAAKSPFTILLLVVCAPVFEELLFRGIILESFLHKYSPQRAIFWSSILFGLIHLNPWQFIAAFAGGLLIGWVYWQTRSLYTSIFIHFIMNFFSFLVSLLESGDEGEMLSLMDTLGGFGIYLILMIISVFALYFLLPILGQIFAQPNRKEEFLTEKVPPAEEKIDNEKIEMEPGLNNEASKQGCLRIVKIGLISALILAIVLAVVCTIAVKKLSNDTLQDYVKQPIIELTLHDDALNDKFIITGVRGNSFLVNVQLIFLEQPESTDSVKYWTEYVAKKSRSLLEDFDMDVNVVVTGVTEDSDGTITQYGTTMYNSFSKTYLFMKSNEFRE